MKNLLKLKGMLEKIANGEAPADTLDDLKRIHGYDPRGLAREGLCVLADLAELLPTEQSTKE
jgi:hypothetical protein